jgi:hypothetical protein
LPSTFTVSNLLDSGAGSLRAAVAAAGNGDTVAFAPGLHGTITLTSGQLATSNSVTIDGPGANRLSVSGNDASRIFDISGSAGVTISGLTITEGRSTLGGGILLEGSAALSISACTLTDNEAKGIAYHGTGGCGGGIEDHSTGALTVTDCTFEGNKAKGIGTDGAGASEGTYGTGLFTFGGAINMWRNLAGTATISDSTFTGNEALGDSPGVSAGGGALSNSSHHGATMTVTGCTISGNSAIGAKGGDGATNFGFGEGGGINDLSSLTVRDSTLTDNLALGETLVPGVPIQSVTLNTAVAGGGILVLDQYVPSTVVIADCTLRGNQAVGGAGAAGSPGSEGEGGGISLILCGPAGIPNGGGGGPAAVVEGCMLADNVARGGAGGSGGAGGPGASGGIDLVFSSAIVSNTLLINNQAIGGAGGDGAPGGDGVGGGIGVGTGFLLFGPPEGSSLTLSNCILASNQAVGGAGGSGSTGGDGLGGGLAILPTSSASGSDSNITANRADGGAAGAGGASGQGLGGGVFNLGAFLSVFTVIEGNHASTAGDDIF